MAETDAFLQNENEKYKDYYIRILTCQAGPFKTLIEAISSILADVNIIFNEQGMFIYEINRTNSAFVDLKLFSDRFESFVFNKPTDQKGAFSVGIRMDSLQKIIKTLGSDNVLVLFVHKDNPEKLGITIECAEKRTKTTYLLNTITLNFNEYKDMPDSSYSAIISLSSTYFQKLCRDAYSVGHRIEIKSNKNMLYFSLDEDTINQQTVIEESADNMHYIVNNEPDEIIVGKYKLKQLYLNN